MQVRLVAPMRESGTNQWRVTVGFCSCVSAILMGVSADYCIGFANRRQTAVEDAVFLLTRCLHSSTAATNALSCRRKPPRHDGRPCSRAYSRAYSRDQVICKAVPVSARAPSVTVVSRHQPGASEWLAQNPFLIPRISKVSASTEEDNFRRCSQRSQLDTHSRHTKNQQ